jgi:hypothetical protein
LLVLSLGYNSFGLPFFYWVKIQLCKLKAEYAESERETKTRPLIAFSSERKGLRQVNADELLVDGKMYDIVKTAVRDGVKYFYAAGDEDEDVYLHKLADSEKDNWGEKSLPLKIFKLYEAKYVVAQQNYSPACYSPDEKNDFGVIPASSVYLSHFKDIFSPPPEPLFS